MTLEEKIEVVRAFSEGKPVEICNILGKWETKTKDVWDFRQYTYRIKPEASTKFKVGDIVVRESDEDWMMPDRRTIKRLNKDICLFADDSEIKTEDLDRYYVNERDVLWYFEGKSLYKNEWSILCGATRQTIPSVEELYKGKEEVMFWKPIYNLGFKLKEN